MASDDDEIHERLIEGFTERLQHIINVEEVLGYLHFIETARKEPIVQKLKSEGNASAAKLLISVVVEKPHTEGWFRAFVDALHHGGSNLAADYLESNPPDPEVEAENDYCVQLIQLLAPSLVDMKTEEVCNHCFSRQLLNDVDKDKRKVLQQKTTWRLKAARVRSPWKSLSPRDLHMTPQV
ncbi:hypothetical protein GOODEAATRI_002789 [Goodea atripinnis]|uniref:Caspase recruitment domain-containing protein n=1 Tax=Goodea atripinnis TaxID=208336 RepID=A0ABV0PKB7_9TELE